MCKNIPLHAFHIGTYLTSWKPTPDLKIYQAVSGQQTLNSIYLLKTCINWHQKALWKLLLMPSLSFDCQSVRCQHVSRALTFGGVTTFMTIDVQKAVLLSRRGMTNSNGRFVSSCETEVSGFGFISYVYYLVPYMPSRVQHQYTQESQEKR
jgi:hypothetical protein